MKANNPFNHGFSFFILSKPPSSSKNDNNAKIIPNDDKYNHVCKAKQSHRSILAIIYIKNHSINEIMGDKNNFFFIINIKRKMFIQGKRIIPLIVLFLFLYLFDFYIKKFLPENNMASIYSNSITLLIFLLILPIWIRYRWNTNINFIRIQNVSKKMFYGLLYSFCLLFNILIILLPNLKIKKSIEMNQIFISISIGLFFGFIEEFLFRWFLTIDLEKSKINKNLVLVIVSSLYSLLHGDIRKEFFKESKHYLGLFLFGLNLGIISKNYGLLTACFFHGFLVSGWLIINDIFDLSIIPKNMIGYMNNPLGTNYGIFLLLIILFYKKKMKNKYRILKNINLCIKLNELYK